MFTYHYDILSVSLEPPSSGKDRILGLLQRQFVLFRVLPLKESVDIVKVPSRSQETKGEVYQSDVIASVSVSRRASGYTYRRIPEFSPNRSSSYSQESETRSASLESPT
jgi:hypothetical protein